MEGGIDRKEGGRRREEGEGENERRKRLEVGKCERRGGSVVKDAGRYGEKRRGWRITDDVGFKLFFRIT